MKKAKLTVSSPAVVVLTEAILPSAAEIKEYWSKIDSHRIDTVGRQAAIDNSILALCSKLRIDFGRLKPQDLESKGVWLGELCSDAGSARKFDQYQKACLIKTAFSLHPDNTLAQKLRNPDFFSKKLLLRLRLLIESPQAISPQPLRYSRTSVVTSLHANPKKSTPTTSPAPEIPKALSTEPPSVAVEFPGTGSEPEAVEIGIEPPSTEPVLSEKKAKPAEIDFGERLKSIDSLKPGLERSNSRQSLIEELLSLCQISEHRLTAFGMQNIKDIISKLYSDDCNLEEIAKRKPDNLNARARFIYTIITNAIYEEFGSTIGKALRSDRAAVFIKNLQALAQMLLAQDDPKNKPIAKPGEVIVVNDPAAAGSPPTLSDQVPLT